MLRKSVQKPELPEGNRVLLEVQGAAMTAEVFLNGEKLAHHEGGYSTFRVDLTEHLREENILAVTVDNSENDYVYPQKADFTFYGGLYRNVNLIIVPAEHFELTMDGTPGLKITPVIDLSAKSAVVKLEAWSVGGQQVHFSLEIRMQFLQSAMDMPVQKLLWKMCTSGMGRRTRISIRRKQSFWMTGRKRYGVAEIRLPETGV